MTTSRRLVVEFLDTWHVGTGRAEAQFVDAVAERDEDGWPTAPARMLRGLVRDACECLMAWEHAKAGEVQHWFGSEQPRTDAPGRLVSTAGGLAFVRGRLPAADRAALSALPDDERKRLSKQFFLQSFQTAIDADTGTARSESLRGIELVVPLTLHAGIEVLPAHAGTAGDAWRLIERALPLVWSAGAHKTRGHGRVRLTLEGAAA